ncbi:MAG: hypothetical protein ACRD2P_03475 [Terriglobia bacterium]
MVEPHPKKERWRAYVAPLVAILSVIASIICCLPLAFLGALGAAGASTVFAVVRPWLLVLSAGMLAVGFVQLYRKRKCSRRSVAAVTLLWVAVAIFLATVFFPQQVAGLLIHIHIQL